MEQARLLTLSGDELENIVAVCSFEDALDLALSCKATRTAFVAVLDKGDVPWPELRERRAHALRAAQDGLDRLLQGHKREKKLRLYAAIELQRRLRNQSAELTSAQQCFVECNDLAARAAQKPYVEDDGEGERPEYGGEATLMYGVRLGYDELKELLFAGRRWYAPAHTDYGDPLHASQARTETPVEGARYHDFTDAEEVARVDHLLRRGEDAEGYQGPRYLDHHLGLDDLLKRSGLRISHRNSQRLTNELKERACDLANAAGVSFNSYGLLWSASFDAHAAHHEANKVERANRHGGNLESFVDVGYTGYGDGPGPEVVLGIPLGPRINACVFDLIQQYGVEFCMDDAPGQCIELASAAFVADLLGSTPTSLKARSVELALRAKMSVVVGEIEEGAGVDLSKQLGFHLVFWEGC